ncbi:MAG: hypothetical protein ABW036_03310 [Flavitalea sp.]
MNSLAVILGFQISVSLVEILIFQIGALILGFSIHFFLTTRKTPPPDNSERPVLAGSSINPDNEWRLKYFEEVESRQAKEQQLRNELEEVRDNENILTIELEEAKKEADALLEKLNRLEEQEAVRIAEATAAAEARAIAEAQAASEAAGEQEENYIAQLQDARTNLQENNQQISRLLEQIDMLKESERKYLSTQKVNEELHNNLHELRRNLFDKETELRTVRQQNTLNQDVQERLEKANLEFSTLQDNIAKLRSHISQPENRGYEYENLQQSFFRLTTEFDALKLRQQSMLEENQRLSILLADADDKLRESNFQRQQLQRKVLFLDELNKDLQQLTEQNRKLESQLKRVTDISQMLEKRDQ